MAIEEKYAVYTEEIDGVVYHFDMETGEILSAERPGFHVEDEKSAEWLLERLQEQDAEIAALNARKNAILENIDIALKRVQNRRNGLLYKYEGELAEYAKKHLPQGKKSWVCPFGKVQFRTSPPRLKVADPEAALAYAETGCPDAIKVTREFQISKLPDDAKESLMAMPTDERTARGFDVTPESESVKIETGI